MTYITERKREREREACRSKDTDTRVKTKGSAVPKILQRKCMGGGEEGEEKCENQCKCVYVRTSPAKD